MSPGEKTRKRITQPRVESELTASPQHQRSSPSDLPKSVTRSHRDNGRVSQLLRFFFGGKKLHGQCHYIMTRSRVGPNRVTQPLRDLRPGRAYLLTVYTGDYGDMANGISEKSTGGNH